MTLAPRPPPPDEDNGRARADRRRAHVGQPRSVCKDDFSEDGLSFFAIIFNIEVSMKGKRSGVRVIRAVYTRHPCIVTSAIPP